MSEGTRKRGQNRGRETLFPGQISREQLKHSHSELESVPYIFVTKVSCSLKDAERLFSIITIVQDKLFYICTLVLIRYSLEIIIFYI